MNQVKSVTASEMIYHKILKIGEKIQEFEENNFCTVNYLFKYHIPDFLAGKFIKEIKKSQKITGDDYFVYPFYEAGGNEKKTNFKCTISFYTPNLVRALYLESECVEIVFATNIYLQFSKLDGFYTKSFPLSLYEDVIEMSADHRGSIKMEGKTKSIELWSLEVLEGKNKTDFESPLLKSLFS